MILISITFLVHVNGVILSEIIPSKLGPSQRYDSTLAYSEISSSIFIFGGKNTEFLDDLWSYSLKTNTWNILYPSSQVPGKKYIEKRSKALSFCRKVPEEFCIYGGLGQKSVLNDLWCFSLKNYVWNQEYTENNPPFMIKFSKIHYKNTAHNYMAVAGLDIFTYSLRFFMYVIFRLDIESFIWEEIPLDLSGMGIEFNLIRFSIIQEMDKIIIPVISSNSTLQAIIEYDINMKSQNVKSLDLTFNQTGFYDFICGAFFQNNLFMVSEIGEVTKIDIKQDRFYIQNLEKLVTSYSKSSCTCFTHICYIFAGQSKDGLHNFLNKIDFSSEIKSIQKTLAINYLSPRSRFNHKMEVINGDFWLFGGTDGTNFFDDLWRYNPRKDIWIEIKKKGHYPTPRHSFSSTASGDLLVIWGGQDKNSLKNDFFIYNANTNLWTEIPTISQQIPSKRKNACITLSLPEAYIYGGTDTKGTLSDLWKFNFLNNTYTKMYDLEIITQPICFQYFTYMMIFGIEKMIEMDFNFKTYEISKISRPADSLIISLHDFYVVVGGRIENKALNTVSSLKLENEKKFIIEDYPYMAAGVYYNKTIYVFGGGYTTPSFSVLPYLPMPRFIKIGIEDFCYNDTCNLRCGKGFSGKSKECKLCPEGFFAYYEFSDYCMSCSSGFYMSNQGGSSDRQCLLCPEGTFSDDFGSKHCKICPPEKYCPIGSIIPLPRNQTSKFIPPQAEFFESFTSNPSSKTSNLLFLVYFLIFLLIISTKLKEKIKNFDLYSRSHALEEGEYIKIQKSTTGGFFTLIFLFIFSLILLYFIHESLYSNIETHKTLIPRMFIEEDINPIVSDIKIDFYLKDYYDRCGDSNPKDQLSIKEFGCGMFINSVHKGLKGKTDLECQKLDGQICHIWFKCENCTSEINSYVQVYSDEGINAAKGIIVNVTAESKVFGPVASNFSFMLYPSYYRKSGFITMSQTSFHVVNMHDNIEGSEFSVENYYQGMRIIINVHLTKSLYGIISDHSFKITPIIIVCIGIGAVSAVFSVVGMFMNAFENARSKKLSIKVTNKEFSSILNRNVELFEEFQGNDYTRHKSFRTERLSENMSLTSGRSFTASC
ncbi:hypothetical protein SteCoe_11756 [Stentor coeruleus]|uniref:Tyrosine-protein kinase ephrin type A/B receptor-like domain-containing protein n=1 Tax=Stentor coeruleus TaxID=5963 RepID=A0A1R2CCG4_9CILI|nr:hypothetical protein SteCoe_11756 [Stentor coeruleus]